MSYHGIMASPVFKGGRNMKKKICCAALLAFALTGLPAMGVNQNSTDTPDKLICDFSEGIPSDFMLYDMDGNELSPDMEIIGFQKGDAWISYNADGNNGVACSTSWYKSSGTSDDWMVTSPVKITGASAILKWRAMAFDENYRDGYSVYISSSGNRVEDFDTSSPVFSVGSEESQWTWHSISLKEYEGKTVWVAFVNNSTDCSRLYVDDLVVGEPDILDFTIDIPRIINLAGEVTVSGKLSSMRDEPIKGVKIGFSCGDMEYEEEFPDLTIQNGESVDFRLGSGFNIASNETLDYTVWVEHEGWRKTIEKTVSAYTRAVVVEEMTGTWCGWCIRGIVILDEMKNKYPQNFIGIAVHSGDPMEEKSYDDALSDLVNNPGYPYCIVNRNKEHKGDPNIIKGSFSMFAEETAEAGIGAEAVLMPDGNLKVNTSLYFVEDRDNLDYRLAYVITENNVHDPTNDEYSQQNYYAGKEEKMGGYENMPAVIPAADMYYQDVARAIIGGFEGVEGSVPASVKAHVPAEYEYTLAMPENVMNPEETELVVLLLDNASGRIVNGRKVSLRELYAADQVYADSSDMLDVSHEGSELHVSATQGKPCSVALYDTCGRLIYSGSAVHHIIPTDGMKGVFVLRADDGTKVCSLKVVM